MRSVRFSLARGSLRAATLADVIDTRAGEPLSAARLEADRERLQQWLVARGHLDAVVEVPTVRVGGDGAAAVEFAVDTGPLYVVRAVVLRGRHADHPGLAAVATLRPGNDAIAERIDGNVELLRDWLAHRGVTATVTARMEPDGFTGEVDVIYTID
ncbi:MAG: hypothetical protein H6709_06145 [Kofleriaceae bacterium]|nr:hypothetical protein [Myxococcales bacterium]MCB9560415.1 hypothetical protein [Kofleriaceae bacterium]MCB9571655.1 hypothetical protein [Kofleriaceae bacterium]